MSIWGAVQDAEKGHKAYVVPADEFADVLPPPPPNNTATATATEMTSTSTVSGTGTKSYVRPTEHLPGDHGSAEGDNSKPAFSKTTDAAAATKTSAEDVAESAAASASNTPTPDEGWFSDLSNLVSNQVWFFVAIGAVVLFAVGAGLFFWRRAVLRRRRANYTSLRGDEHVAMGALGGRVGGSTTRGPQRTTKELYDAFGEVSDDDEADEETALRPHSISPALDTGLHSGFLDDDPPTAGSGHHDTRYRDEPDEPAKESRSESPASGSGSGSGSSWEHASETR